MKYALILVVGLTFLIASCSKETKEEKTIVVDPNKDSITGLDIVHTKVNDYPERVSQFRKMPDSNIEEQVQKYETFSKLFIEYGSIDKNQTIYSAQEQEDNTEAYMVLRDEMVSLKNKLIKSISTINSDQEKRLDAADAEMNKLLPNVYKEEQPKE